MTITIHDLAIDTYVNMLDSLTHVLGRAAEHAAARKFELSALVNARLAPDMFPLSTQVYLSCHHARDGVARLTGQDPPAIERLEESFEQVTARVATTLAQVQAAPRAAFDGAEQRTVTITVNPERIFDLTGLQFLRDWNLPHFYFHVVTAYDILRDCGVELGKRDYVRHMPRYLRKP
jgi:hypothetical protein